MARRKQEMPSARRDQREKAARHRVKERLSGTIRVHFRILPEHLDDVKKLIAPYQSEATEAFDAWTEAFDTLPYAEQEKLLRKARKLRKPARNPQDVQAD